MKPCNKNRIQRKNEVIATTGLSSSTIDRLEKKGMFPQRVKLSPHLIGWHSTEIQDYLSNLPRAFPNSRDDGHSGNSQSVSEGGK